MKAHNQEELDKAIEQQKKVHCTIEIFFAGAVLRENSSAVLRENSSAVLWENSSAVLRENSRAELWDFSAAWIYNNNNQVKKGSCATIIIPKYPNTIEVWCKMKGVRIKNNRIMLWKTTNKEGKDFYTNSILYDSKKEIICPDWEDNFSGECGAGLHLADSPSAARLFCEGKENARLFKMSANINDCVVLGGFMDYPMKIRAKKCRMVREYPFDHNE